VNWKIAISGSCLLLLAANIALVLQNRELKAQLSQPPPTFEAVPGSHVPDLRGFDELGRPLEVRYGKEPRKTLVLVYSPTCGFCDENWPKWLALVPTLDRAAVRPVLVDVTATSSQAFLAAHHLDGVPVFVQVDPRAALGYRFHLTPQTILVDSTGRVERVWTGVLNDSNTAELEQLVEGARSASTTSGNRRSF
jgi:hypothetical protein